MPFEIRNSDKPLPDEEDVYGVNEINEYDADYWLPNEIRSRRKKIILRIIAAMLVLAFVVLTIRFVW